ncbi:restriction endonuclease subunit S [Vibrio aestuarianus]|nr:restriction endonuclease subunit S [Vibrio aestuarianus]
MTGRYKAYPEYKDSGVDWLPALPSSWCVERTKRMFSLKRSLVGQQSSEYQLLSLTLKGVIPRDISSGEGKIPESFDTYQKVDADDLVFCLFDMDETPRTIGLSPSKGMITGAYNVYGCLDTCVPNYAYYYFLHIDSFKGLKPFYTGLRKVVRAETFGNVEMPCPSVDEQQKIANFLDHETAKIDTLITKQEKLIELLKEKRQAVISHAVTKGLNPLAPMKDSGVEWLGEVPEHWGEAPLKALFDIKHGYAFDSKWFDDDGQLILLTPGNFEQTGGFKYKNPEKYYVGKNVPKEFILNGGDLLIAMTEQGPGLLGCGLFVPNENRFLLNQRVGKIINICTQKINKEYLCHLFNSSRYRAEVSVSSTGSKVKHTSPEKILALKVYLPPLDEQTEISNFISKALGNLTSTESKVSKTISLLKERKTALISAAVTGKIDVRDWQPQGVQG